MKSQNKLILVLLSGLGLFAITGGAKANAQTNPNGQTNSANITLTSSQRPRHHEDQGINILVDADRANHANLDHSNSIDETGSVSDLMPSDNHDNDTDHNANPVGPSQAHNHQNLKRPDKLITKSKQPANKGNRTHLSKNNKVQGRKDLHNLHLHNLHYDHTRLPIKPSPDRHFSDVDKMNRFAKLRKPFHYTMIGGNTRDLGGYRTADHKHQIQAGRIIRSADLNGISKAGIKVLQELHVNKIIDLRYLSSRDGIQGHPDPNELHDKTLTGTNIQYQQNPVYSRRESHEFTHYMKSHDIHGEYYFYSAPSVTEPQAIQSYRTTFRDLLNNHNGAILYHCNLGRDRTGVTSALILSALGVSRRTIFHDYLLTDYYHYNYQHKPYPQQAGELLYFFNTIKKKYGNVDNYLHRAIGLSHQDVHKLRAMYLIPSRVHQNPIKLRNKKNRRTPRQRKADRHNRGRNKKLSNKHNNKRHQNKRRHHKGGHNSHIKLTKEMNKHVQETKGDNTNAQTSNH